MKPLSEPADGHLAPPRTQANWRQVADAAPPLAEPITIAEWSKNSRGESIRHALTRNGDSSASGALGTLLDMLASRREL
jgi:hypothetical protein